MEEGWIRKKIIKIIEKTLKSRNTCDVLNWITLRIIFSRAPTKHSFCDLIAGITVKNINKNTKRLTFFTKRKIVWLYRLILADYFIESFLEILKNRKSSIKIKHELEARFYLKMKYLFYRGDGFINQLIEVSDKLYSPLDDDIEQIKKYSYTDVRNMFIYIFQQLNNKATKFDFYLEKVDIENKFGKYKFDRIIEDFGVTSNINEEYRDIFDYSELSKKPIIVLNDKIYVPILSHLIYNIPKFFHYELLQLDKTYNNDKSAIDLKNKYTQIRGKNLELLLVEYLSRHVEPKNIFHDLKYKGGEADVIVQLPEETVLFEVKGKLLTLNSYKGISESIEDDFKKAIQDAYKQAFRTYCHIETGGVFYREVNKKNKFRLQKAKKYYKVCITVDNFSMLAIELDKYLTLEKKDKDYPISFNLFDFEYIMNRINDINQFTRYLEYRMEYYGVITSVDEIEIFEAYMKGINFKKEKNTTIFITKMATEFEEKRNMKEHVELLERKIENIKKVI